MKFFIDFKKETMMQTLYAEEAQDVFVIPIGKPTYQKAKEIIRGRVKNMEEYKTFRKNYPHYQLPSSPRQGYKDEFVSNYDFFGTTPTTPRQLAIKEHWDKVKSGEIVRKPYTKKSEVAKSEPVAVAESKVDERILLINLMKKYNILDLCKDGVRALFTYEDLMEIVIK